MAVVACRLCLSPEQFGLQAFEEGLNGGIIKAVFLAGHGRGHFVFRQFLLEIMRAVLAPHDQSGKYSRAMACADALPWRRR